MQLDLFRIKVFQSPQLPLLEKQTAPSDALRAALLEQPTSRPYRGVSWHIGNVESLDGSGMYFRLGKQSKATLSLLDDVGNFTEAEFDTAPYTHALIDVHLELCALARNTSLAPTAEGIARRLAGVINESQTASTQGIRFRVGPVSNPDEFLAVLASAFSIHSFTFAFQQRNPFDAHKDFVQPFERLVDATKAAAGQVTVKGRDLVPAPLEEITRSAAATGDDAKARLKTDEQSHPVVRTLRGDNATVTVDALDTASEKTGALERVRAEHERIRRTD